MTMTGRPDEVVRVGVIGAGRVGAVLAAALRECGYEISAVAAESDASLSRAETLLPGVPTMKPTAVARSCDLLLLTVPDDMLDNVVRMLTASGALRAEQYVAHTSGRHGLEVLRPAVDLGAHGMALHPAMTFTGTAKDLPRLVDCAFGVTAEDPNAVALAERLVEELQGRLVWVPEDKRTIYHAGLAHGANHLVTLVAQSMDLLRESGATDPAATLRPLLTAALDNALNMGDAALTGPVVRGDVETVRAHLEGIAGTRPGFLPAYVALARATVNSAVLDGRLVPMRAAKMVGVLNDALEQLTPPQHRWAG
jgi:predicted short-subunit dehydrogenase-like oxidoreductase (DUF2520 family)